MHSFLFNLFLSVIDLLDDLRKQQAEIAGVSGSEVYANQMAFGHVVPKSPPRILPFIATNFKVKDFVDLSLVPLPIPHYLEIGHARFILSMRKLCASSKLDPRVIKLLHPDGDRTVVITLIKQTNKIIALAQTVCEPAVLVRDPGGEKKEKEYMRLSDAKVADFACGPTPIDDALWRGEWRLVYTMRH
ncbi:hypothetical protein T492DRAFT_846592 [Pavlovales sp. CCMP2436]|nr:hypothetical protein T492DRAFT_846592 [Pavlovales sp. CCMP2436]